MDTSAELPIKDRGLILDTQQVFNSLVRNAIDFFQHSIKEFEDNPKYSVIHFFAAIELFFKARLLLEHWSLIVDDPKKANYEKFISGEFASVGLDEAMNRLAGISGESFGRQEKEVFSNIRAHRNRLMHFYHDRYARNDPGTLTQIAGEECQGWYGLYQLLTTTWQSKFTLYITDLQELQNQMNKQKEYLRAKFEFLQQRIREDILKGVTYISCPSCGFISSKLSTEEVGLIVASCLVCENQFDTLYTICPHCEKKTIIDDSRLCTQCKELIYIPELIWSFDGRTDRWAYCDECQYNFLPSIASLNDQWICLSCMKKYEDRDIHKCGWCGEYVTGDTGDYYSPGCFMCAIHIEEETTGISDRFQKEDRGHER
jgi:hypothetical protein